MASVAKALPAGPLRVCLGLVHGGIRAAAVLDPWLLLATRVWLAQAFLVLQVTMLMSGRGLAATLGGGWWSEILAHVATGGLGGAVQAICPLLLILGLLTRPAAAAMLLQVLLLRYDERAELHVFWAALLAMLVVRGAGPLSLDGLLGQGVANSAVPGVQALGRFYVWLGKRGVSGLLLALRVLVAAVLLAPHVTQSGLAPKAMAMAMVHEAMAMLPATPGLIEMVPAPASILAACAVLIGIAVRPIAVILLVLAPIARAGVADDAIYWVLILGFLLIEGGGAVALDRLVARALAGMAKPPGADAYHVVIVGGGFGGYAVARGLGGTACRVTLIDRRNYHLFQPLLYQVATAGLSPADIATPIRGMVRDHTNIHAILGTVTGVDRAARQVLLGTTRIDYDTLVLATGARHAYFGRDEWSELAPGLKTIEDATAIRRRLLLAFESAETASDTIERQAWLTFVIVGGGPTGVELAGAIAELARFGMADEFRSIDPAAARVVLVQSAPRLLPTFPAALSDEAAAALTRLGVEVLLDAKAEEIDSGGVTTSGVTTSGGRIPARTVLWAAGVAASPAARWLGVEADRAGRVVVGPDLRVPGLGDIFAIGDTCASRAWRGKPVPGLAPAAKQAGTYVARAIRATVNGRPAPPPFVYRHFGSLATIGRKAAVAEFGRIHCKGAFAWWLWGAAHVLFLVDGRNRTGVVLNWLWDYFTLRRGTRLITDAAPPAHTALLP